MLGKISILFAAGARGGLTNAVVVWLTGYLGLTGALGVKIAPPLTLAMIYARVVWGGAWGLVFALPMLKSSIIRRGFVVSLIPTLVQLFVVFPLKAAKGYGGVELGLLTPLFVILFNAVWGITAALWLRLTNH